MPRGYIIKNVFIGKAGITSISLLQQLVLQDLERFLRILEQTIILNLSLHEGHLLIC